MNNEEKINYLNRQILFKDMFEYGGPKYLYKYRSFDEFSFDMLTNKYVYLCPAEKEDDETECLTSFDFEQIFDLKTNNLKRECFNQIIELLKPYSSKETYEKIRNLIMSNTRKDGTVAPNIMLDLALYIQNEAPEYKEIMPNIVNWIVMIPKKLDESEISGQLEPLFLIAYNSRRETGICSFAESKDNEYMWKNYAKDYSGYCIEYDVSDYENNFDILPVIYKDKRDTNIINALVSSFIGLIINNMSNGQIQADTSQFIRLFITKYSKWKYQKEWRLIGKANGKIAAPKIKTIYLGKNISETNKKKITEFAGKMRINIIQQS